MAKSKKSSGRQVSTCMVVQQLRRNYFNWTNPVDNGRYSDKVIIKLSNEFENANSKGYDEHSPEHYLYNVYQTLYWPYLNEYRHKFNDYDYIFNNRNLQTKAKLIMIHVALRLEVFSFVDFKRNSKHYNRKKAKKARKFKPMKLAGILHDADKSIHGDIVKPHFHMAIKLGNRATFEQLSNWSGIPPQYFDSKQVGRKSRKSLSFKGRYAFQNEVAYLTHSKQPNKHFYSPKRVISNFDYMKFYKAHCMQWESYKSRVERKSNKMNSAWLEKLVADGRITYDDILTNTKLYNIFTSSVSTIRAIKALLQARADRVSALTRKALEKRKFGLSVIFICGPSGAGKSTVADHIVHKIHKKYGWKVYKPIKPQRGSKPHPFDNYKGEPIVYWDEARSNEMDPSQWLQLMDPRHEDTMDARRYAKPLATRVIVITTYDSPDTFFGFMRGVHQDEPLTGFMRRLGVVIHVRVVNGRHRYWIDPIVNRGHRVPLKITKTDRTTKQHQTIVKTTQYTESVPDINPVGFDTAINQSIQYVKHENNPKLPHPPAKRPLLNENKPTKVINYAVNAPGKEPRNVWWFYNRTVVVLAKSERDTELRKKYPNFKFSLSNKYDYKDNFLIGGYYSSPVDQTFNPKGAIDDYKHDNKKK